MAPALLACLFSTAVTAALAGPGLPNLLVLVVDDLGIDHVGVYGEVPFASVTPNIDALAQNGVLFRNAWVCSSCSPTRASILTGRHPARHGIGSALQSSDAYGLALSEVTLAELLTISSGGVYDSYAIGKWHLAGALDGPQHALLQGFAQHVGSFGNLNHYYEWEKLTNGVPGKVSNYATSETVDDALGILGAAEEPWFGWIAFNAPHEPLHAPPAALCPSISLGGMPMATPLHHTRAMVEALDAEIGRLLAGLDPAVLENTTIVLVSDNGTISFSTLPPFPSQHGKGTPYEGGINVPLIVAGAGVVAPGRECTDLVQGTDLFATLAELAGADVQALLAGTPLDCVSFAPVLADQPNPEARPWVFAQAYLPQPPLSPVRESWTVRDARYKLIQQRVTTASGVIERIELFDLELDPFEQQDLLVLPGGPPPEYWTLEAIGLSVLATF